MLRYKKWLEYRAKYLSLAIFNKTQKQESWENVYSRLYKSVIYENKAKNIIEINEVEYRNIRKQIWSENMPKKTNFDRITENEGALAEYISSLARKCTFRDCSKEECAKFECKDCIKEWLQKECEE